MDDIKDKQIHFIIGIGRSGTTLLTKLLNKHKDIHCQPEANFLLFFLHHFKNRVGFNDHDIELIFKEISTYSLSHPTIGWNINFDKAKQTLKTICSANPDINYATLCKHIYSLFEIEHQNKKDAKLIIDKNPAYTILVDKIAGFLPEAKFIWMIRDYRANVLSRKQNVYLKSPKVAYNAIRWKYFNMLALKFSKKNPHKVLLVRYEDLVNDPGTVISSIYTFLNVDPKDETNRDTISFTETKNDASLIKHEKYLTKKYDDLEKPVNTGRVNSWKTELSKKEIDLCDAICLSFAKQFEYTAFSALTLLHKYMLLLKHMVTISRSIADIEKDRLLYYLPIHYKIKRLIKRHMLLGFLQPHPKE